MRSGTMDHKNGLTKTRAGMTWALVARVCLLVAVAAFGQGSADGQVLLESFDDGNLDEYTDVFLENLGSWVSVTAAAAHDGPFGLQYTGQIGNWIFRDDPAVHVEQGDVLSVWIRLDGAFGRRGRGFFGFGATASGTLAMVMAPNTGELLLQVSTNRYNRFKTIGSAPQTWLIGHWYRMEVTWETSGTITGRLYDSDGATLLNTVTATNTAITSGGIGFRSFETGKSFDTVQVLGEAPPGVVVASIDPSSLPRNTTAPVTITGSGFLSGATVTFENGGGRAPTATNIIVVNDTTIDATVSVPKRAKLLVWDVRVTNPDASSDVLVDGFTVTP